MFRLIKRLGISCNTIDFHQRGVTFSPLLERFKLMKRPTIISVVILVAVGILMHFYCADRFSACASHQLVATGTKNPTTVSEAEDFPAGTGTSSLECGECHQAMYREYAYGFGTDVMHKSPKEELPSLKGRESFMGVSADFYIFSDFLSASSFLCFAVLHSGVRQTVEGRSGHVQSRLYTSRDAFSGLSHRPL